MSPRLKEAFPNKVSDDIAVPRSRIPELLELNRSFFDPHQVIEIAIKYNRSEDRREEHIRLPKIA